MRADAPETEGRFIAVGDKLQVRLPQGKPIEGTVIFKAVEGDYATQRDVSRRKRDIKTIGLEAQGRQSGRRTGAGHDRRGVAAERLCAGAAR